jgi:hypothetical protein
MGHEKSISVTGRLDGAPAGLRVISEKSSLLSTPKRSQNFVIELDQLRGCTVLGERMRKSQLHKVAGKRPKWRETPRYKTLCPLTQIITHDTHYEKYDSV